VNDNIVSPPAIVKEAEVDLGELAKRINVAHEASGEDIRRGLEHRRETGRWLVEAQERCQQQQVSWLGWLKANVTFNRMTANRYIRLASGKCNSVLQMSLRKVLKELSESEGKTTHVSQNGGEHEWYTPVEYLDAARAVLGQIDLDPASSEIAQRTVRAATYFTKDGDGLNKPWAGRLWLNPPYAAELIGRFTKKLCERFEGGDVSQAVVLVKSATETSWFQQLASTASAICFPASRVRFLDPEGNLGALLQGQAVLYLGDEPGKFIAAFAAFGFLMMRCGVHAA
jgi:ParB family chromosome partitioning protein